MDWLTSFCWKGTTLPVTAGSCPQIWAFRLSTASIKSRSDRMSYLFGKRIMSGQLGLLDGLEGSAEGGQGPHLVSLQYLPAEKIGMGLKSCPPFPFVSKTTFS